MFEKTPAKLSERGRNINTSKNRSLITILGMNLKANKQALKLIKRFSPTSIYWNLFNLMVQSLVLFCISFYLIMPHDHGMAPQVFRSDGCDQLFTRLPWFGWWVQLIKHRLWSSISSYWKLNNLYENYI